MRSSAGNLRPQHERRPILPDASVDGHDGLDDILPFPGVEIKPFYSVMPVVGAALLLKEMLANPDSQAAFVRIPVLVTSVGYGCWRCGGPSTSFPAKMC